jgi:hypothetical protein
MTMSLEKGEQSTTNEERNRDVKLPSSSVDCQIKKRRQCPRAGRPDPLDPADSILPADSGGFRDVESLWPQTGWPALYFSCRLR